MVLHLALEQALLILEQYGLLAVLVELRLTALLMGAKGVAYSGDSTLTHTVVSRVREGLALA